MNRTLLCFAAALLAVSSQALAAPPAAPGVTVASLGSPAPADGGPTPVAPTAPDHTTRPPKRRSSDSGAFVVGAKVGALLPFNGLGPNAVGTVELGYVFPWARRSFALLVDASFSSPDANGTQSDPRVQGGTYGWQLTQKELAVMPIVLYRLTGLGRVVPYLGAGPRVLMLQSSVQGTVGSQAISPSTEQATKVGLGAPLGAEMKLGPGRLLGEFLFEWESLDDASTGSKNNAAGTVQIGYRFLI